VITKLKELQVAKVLAKEPGTYPRGIFDLSHNSWQMWLSALSAYNKENGLLTGVSGSFTTVDGKTVTVVDGIITSIV